MRKQNGNNRSGYDYGDKEKAYHVYMYTLQNRNYGTKVSEYIKSHGISRNTFCRWQKRFPGGGPFFDPNSDILDVDTPEISNQLVKLAPMQLESPGVVEKPIPHSVSEGIISVKYCGAEISVDKDSILSVILALKSVNGLVQ